MIDYETAYEIALAKKDYAIAAMLKDVGYARGYEQVFTTFKLALTSGEETTNTYALEIFPILVAARKDFWFKDQIAERTKDQIGNPLFVRNTPFVFKGDKDLFVRMKTDSNIDVVGELIHLHKFFGKGFTRLGKAISETFIDCRALVVAPEKILEFVCVHGPSLGKEDGDRLQWLKILVRQFETAEQRLKFGTLLEALPSNQSNVRDVLVRELLRDRAAKLFSDRAFRELDLLEKSESTNQFDYIAMALDQRIAIDKALNEFLGVMGGSESLQDVSIHKIPGLTGVLAGWWQCRCSYKSLDSVSIEFRRVSEIGNDDWKHIEGQLALWAKHWFTRIGKDSGLKFLELKLGRERSILVGE